MPEGDSIYLEARKLDAALKGRRIVRGELRVAALVGAELVGTTVLENDTHGKHLLTRFDNGQTLHTHLRKRTLVVWSSLVGRGPASQSRHPGAAGHRGRAIRAGVVDPGGR